MNQKTLDFDPKKVLGNALVSDQRLTKRTSNLAA